MWPMLTSLNHVTQVMRAVMVSALLISTSLAAESPSRKLKTQVAPAYPELARKLHITGKVRLQVEVAADGKVKSVVVKGGNPVLADAAEKAVAKWRYMPGEEETLTVEVNFRPQQ
jgi:TonB family protein